MPVKDGQIFCSHEGVDEAVWECRLSGQSKITFEEAQKSEEKHRQILAVSNLVELKNQSLKCLNPNPRFKKNEFQSQSRNFPISIPVSIPIF